MEKYKKAKENKDPSETKEIGKGATISYDPFASPTKDQLFPHAEDKHGASPARSRKTLTFGGSSVQNDLISWSPIPTRKLESAPNLRSIPNDPFKEFISPSNPFEISSPDAITPSFNPFKMEKQPNNPFVV